MFAPGSMIPDTPQYINTIMDFSNIGIAQYVCGGSIDYPGYSPEMAAFKLTRSMNTPVTVQNIGVHDHLLLHVINQMLIPKVSRSNDLTAIEVFYIWCVHQYSFHIDMGFTILNHMKTVISQSFYELPYGMMITKITLANNVYLSGLEGECANTRANFDKKTPRVHGNKEG